MSSSNEAGGPKKPPKFAFPEEGCKLCEKEGTVCEDCFILRFGGQKCSRKVRDYAKERGWSLRPVRSCYKCGSTSHLAKRCKTDAKKQEDNKGPSKSDKIAKRQRREKDKQTTAIRVGLERWRAGLRGPAPPAIEAKVDMAGPSRSRDNSPERSGSGGSSDDESGDSSSETVDDSPICVHGGRIYSALGKSGAPEFAYKPGLYRPFPVYCPLTDNVIFRAIMDHLARVGVVDPTNLPPVECAYLSLVAAQDIWRLSGFPSGCADVEDFFMGTHNSVDQNFNTVIRRAITEASLTVAKTAFPAFRHPPITGPTIGSFQFLEKASSSIFAFPVRTWAACVNHYRGELMAGAYRLWSFQQWRTFMAETIWCTIFARVSYSCTKNALALPLRTVNVFLSTTEGETRRDLFVRLLPPMRSLAASGLLVLLVSWTSSFGPKLYQHTVTVKDNAQPDELGVLVDQRPIAQAFGPIKTSPLITEVHHKIQVVCEPFMTSSYKLNLGAAIGLLTYAIRPILPLGCPPLLFAAAVAMTPAFKPQDYDVLKEERTLLTPYPNQSFLCDFEIANEYFIAFSYGVERYKLIHAVGDDCCGQQTRSEDTLCTGRSSSILAPQAGPLALRRVGSPCGGKLLSPTHRRVVAYGYRYGVAPLAPFDYLPTPDVKIFNFRPYNVLRSPPVYVSLGVHVDGAALPKPDLSDAVSLMAGAMKRFLAPSPPQFMATLGPGVYLNSPIVKCGIYAASRCRQLWEPLFEIPPFMEWIESRPYPRWRKDQLIARYNVVVDPSIFPIAQLPRLVKEHMKDEPYPEYKYPRPINAADDDWKIFLGPIFSAMEAVIFKHPAFIKRVPIADRPRYIKERLGVLRRAAASDFSSFEAAMKRPVMTNIEFQVYVWMLSRLSLKELNLLLRLCGMNHVQNRYYAIKLLARRMSGEMNTSLGNGVTNFLLQEFVCLIRLNNDWMAGVFEGDDGLFVVSDTYPKPEDYLDLGFSIKLDVFESITEASFCGLIFDPEDLANVADPRECLMTFGWTTREYMYAKSKKLDLLLIAKAYSYLAQYPGCPVLQPLALWILSTVPHDREELYFFVSEKMVTSMWDREQLMDAIKSSPKPRPIGIRTRLLMEKKFSFTLQQQTEIEELFLRRTETKSLGPIPLHYVGEVHQHCLDYFSKYVTEIDLRRDGVGAFVVNYPVHQLVAHSDFQYQTPVDHAELHRPLK